MKKVFIFLTIVASSFVSAQNDAILEGNIFDSKRAPETSTTVTAGSAEAMPRLTAEPGHDDMYFNELLWRTAKEANLHANAISQRKQYKGDGFQWTRIYMGYDGNLEQLTRFFELIDGRVDGLQLEGLNIAARREPKNGVSDPSRSPLNGNMILRLGKGEQAANASGERYVANRLLLGMTQLLPKDTHLLSLVVKSQNSVVLMGRTNDVDQLLADMRDATFLNNPKPASAIVSKGDDSRRYLIKAEIDFAGLPSWSN